MTFKKSGKTIFGMSLNAAEQKFLDQEIQRQYSEYLRDHEVAIEAQLLWFMHVHEKHGVKRLKDDFRVFAPLIGELIQAYEMADKDGGWLCVNRLKAMGVDIQEWKKELEQNEKES